MYLWINGYKFIGRTIQSSTEKILEDPGWDFKENFERSVK